jgi:hypothetical protein
MIDSQNKYNNLFHMNFINCIILILGASCGLYSQTFKKVGHKQLNNTLQVVKYDFNQYVIINIYNNSEGKKYLASVTTDNIKSYYIDFIDNSLNKPKYLKFIKNLLNGSPIIVKYDAVFRARFGEYLINDSIYTKLSKLPIDTMLKEYADKKFMLNTDIKPENLNALIKILYDKNISVVQDDFSGEFYIRGLLKNKH